MKTIFEPDVREGLIRRIERLSENCAAGWGIMTPYQMVKHCNLSEEMFLGKRSYKRLFVGRLFGRLALKSILRDDSDLKQSQPTHPEFKIKGTGNLEAEKRNWIQNLGAYTQFQENGFVHPFFGPMTREQIGGRYVYKHTDHHLRQFGID